MLLRHATCTTRKTLLPPGPRFYRLAMRITSLLSATLLPATLLPATLLTIPFLSMTAAEPVIKLVSSLPRTGSANAQTTTIVNGIRLALKESGEVVNGFRIEYEDWDDASPERGQWDPAVENANADKAIADPDVMAYIGTYNSGAAKIVMAKLNQAGLLMISPGNTAVGLTKPGSSATEPGCYRPTGKVTYFRVVPADDLQGRVGAEFAKELGVKRVFVLHDRELYGQGIADQFKVTAAKLGVDVVGYEGIDGKAANYKSLITKIRALSPDLVYFGGTTQTNASQIAKDMMAGGLKAKFMVPDGCREDAFIEAAGPGVLEGRTFVTFGGVPPEQLSGKGATFLNAYRAAFQADPQAYAVYGYEVGRVLLDALKRAGKKDRQALITAVAATKDFSGTLGTWSFDANGDTSLAVLSVSTVEAGKFKPLKVIGQ